MCALFDYYSIVCIKVATSCFVIIFEKRYDLRLFLRIYMTVFMRDTAVVQYVN